MKRRSKKPLVTVYTVCHNYGRFLSQAVESVLSQSFAGWELLVFDDGSTDQTRSVMKRYSSLANVRLFHQAKQGLIKTCNRAIEEARGKYLLRLDADDYLDENALLILSQTLEKQSDVSMAYPDFYLVNEEGAILEHMRQNAVDTDARVLDLPAHGACSLIRRKTLLEIQKYDEKNNCQDGYDLWLKLSAKNLRVKSVNLPLFYYRRHGENLTTDDSRILSTRQSIKTRFVREAMKGEKKPEVLAIIPTRGTKAGAYSDPLGNLADKVLIDYTLDAASQSELLGRSVVVSEDGRVLDHAKRRGFDTLCRPVKLGGPSSRIETTVLWTLKELARRGYKPDLVMLLYIHVPLRRPAHIDEAIYSQMIFKTDSVISVTRNSKFLYRHDTAHGMIPLYKKRLLRQEKDVLYEENGAVELSRVEVVTEQGFLGKTIGHILMGEKDSVQINGVYERWLVAQLIKEGVECLVQK